MADASPPAAGRRCNFSHPCLIPANHGTAIHFIRHDESDFGIGSGSSSFDLHVRDELMGRKSCIEDDDNVYTQGIESIALDGVEDRSEILFLVQIVCSVNDIDARVVVDQRIGGGHLK